MSSARGHTRKTVPAIRLHTRATLAGLTMFAALACVNVAPLHRQRDSTEKEVATSAPVGTTSSFAISGLDAGAPKQNAGQQTENKLVSAERWIAERCRFKPAGDNSPEILEGTDLQGSRFVEALVQAAEPIANTSAQTFKIDSEGFAVGSRGKEVSVKREPGAIVSVNGARFKDPSALTIFNTVQSALNDISANGFHFIQLNGGIAHTRRLVPQGGIVLVFAPADQYEAKPEDMLRIFMSFMRDYRGLPPEISYTVDAYRGSSPNVASCSARP